MNGTCYEASSETHNHQKKVLFLVLSKATNIANRQNQRDTWIADLYLEKKNCGVVYRVFYIVGLIPSEVKEDLMSEMMTNGDIIEGLFLDNYKNLTLKVQMGLEWAVSACSNFDYVIKTDDDVYVNVFKLSQFINTLHVNKPMFGGKCMFKDSPIRNIKSKWFMSKKLYPRRMYPPFCVGPFYMMSMIVAKRIRSVFAEVAPVHLEDVFMGICMRKVFMVPTHDLKDTVWNFLQIKGAQRLVIWPHKLVAIHFGQFAKALPHFHQQFSNAQRNGTAIKAYSITLLQNKTMKVSIIYATNDKDVRNLGLI